MNRNTMKKKRQKSKELLDADKYVLDIILL